MAGARNLAIVLVLGDAGPRCEELGRLERRAFLPTRQRAKLRALHVRHGKGDRHRRVKLSDRAAHAIVRWDRERTRAFEPPAHDAPLFITLGSRRRDGSYTRVGRRCGKGAVADLVKRLGASAELPGELRHPHALRHTCATELLRAGATRRRRARLPRPRLHQDHVDLSRLQRGPPGTRGAAARARPPHLG